MEELITNSIVVSSTTVEPVVEETTMEFVRGKNSSSWYVLLKYTNTGGPDSNKERAATVESLNDSPRIRTWTIFLHVERGRRRL